MNIEQLLRFCTEMGKQLMQNGAEIYRVEDSVEHVLNAYGFQQVEVFAIPACIIITIEDQGKSYTRTARMKSSFNNFHKLNNLNDLCRTVCREKPDLGKAEEELAKVVNRLPYPKKISFIAYGLVAFFFTLFWGGNILDALISFVCGLTVKYMVSYMIKVNANIFFMNLISSIVLATIPVILVQVGLPLNLDLIIIGAIMLLVPGIAITNVMRDIMAGDYLTAISKLTEVLIVAMGIALGIAVPITGIPALMSLL